MATKRVNIHEVQEKADHVIRNMTCGFAFYGDRLGLLNKSLLGGWTEETVHRDDVHSFEWNVDSSRLVGGFCNGAQKAQVAAAAARNTYVVVNLRRLHKSRHGPCLPAHKIDDAGRACQMWLEEEVDLSALKPKTAPKAPPKPRRVGRWKEEGTMAAVATALVVLIAMSGPVWVAAMSALIVGGITAVVRHDGEAKAQEAIRQTVDGQALVNSSDGLRAASSAVRSRPSFRKPALVGVGVFLACSFALGGGLIGIMLGLAAGTATKVMTKKEALA